jgi:hypothetical protein
MPFDPFTIVKDSSIWRNGGSYSAVTSVDHALRVGIVQEVIVSKDGQIRCLVQVQDTSRTVPMLCRLVSRFGGVYNYEDTIHRGYKTGSNTSSSFDTKAGDIVLVGQLNGQGREGVILGSLMHPARRTTLDPALGPQYDSTFNGVQTSINEVGEYSMVFKGLPTNIATLLAPPSKTLPQPIYDATVGSTFVKFDKTGSWEVSDNSQSGIQSIKIDKPGGSIALLSGKVAIKVTKGDESVSSTSKLLTIVATDKITATTKEVAVAAEQKVGIKSAKIAIGKEGVELLDQLAKLIDALSTVTPISPLGPCTPLKSTPQWAQVEQIKAKIKEITGTF